MGLVERHLISADDALVIYETQLAARAAANDLLNQLLPSAKVLVLPVGLHREFRAEELGGRPGETAVIRCKELRAEDWFLVTR
jgi:hypothetical protein